MAEKITMTPDMGEDTGVKVMPEGGINPSALVPSEPTSTGGEGFAPSQSASYEAPMEPPAPEIDLSADDLEYGELVEPVEPAPVAPTQEQDDDAIYGELEEEAEDPVVIVGDEEEETMATAGYDYSESVPNSFLNSMAQVESSWRYDVKAGTTSATGLFQFIDSTWLAEIKKNFPEDVAGMSNAQILEMRKDPYMSTKVAAKFTEGNAKTLTSRGHEVTDGNLYLAHFLGANGASRALDVWNGDPSTPIAQAVKANVIRSNPALFDPSKTRNPITTVGGLVEWASRKMEKAGKRAKGDVATLLPVEAPKEEAQPEQQIAQAPVQETVQPTPLGDGIYEDPDTGKPFRMQGGRMYDLRTGERLDVDPVQDTGSDVGTIAEGTGGFERRTLEGTLQENLAGVGINENAPELVKEVVGANLFKNVSKAVGEGNVGSALAEVGFELAGPVGDALRTLKEPAQAMLAGFMKSTRGQTDEGLQTLQAAKELEEAGMPADIIWKKTGLEKGPDGEWRFEIDDSEAQIIKLPKVAKPGERGSVRYLDEILDHPELFKQYPYLNQIHVALYDPAHETIAGAKGFAQRGAKVGLNASNSPEQMRSTLLHEVQHIIQDAKFEDWITGTAPKVAPDAAQMLESQKGRVFELAKSADVDLESQGQFMLGAIAAAYTGGKKGLDDYVKLLKDSDIIGANFTDFKLQQAENFAFFLKESGIEGMESALREVSDTLRGGIIPAYSDYFRKYGEVMSRNVQARDKMTAAQRADLPPSATQDVPDSRVQGEYNQRIAP